MQKYAAGDTFVVSVSGYAYNVSPNIIALADGGWLINWESEEYPEYKSHHQGFDENGQEVGEEVELAGVNYVFAALSNGGWVTGYTNYHSNRIYENETYVSLYDSGGQVLISNNRANTFTFGAQSVSAIEGLADGGWIVTWSGFGEDNFEDTDIEIYQQRYDSAGSAVGQNQRVNSTTELDQTGARVTALQDGGWIVTWIGTRLQGYYTGDAFLQRYDEDGNAVGGEVRVSDLDKMPESIATVTGLADGGWVVAWQTYLSGDTFMHQQRFAADGERVGLQAALDLDGYVGSPQVDGLPDGGWVMSYFARSDGPLELRAQVFSAEGDQIGREIVVDSGFINGYANRTITALGDGRFVVAWSFEVMSQQTEIRQRVFSLTDNEGPIAEDDNFSMTERGTLTVNLLTNDADSDNEEKLSLESAVVLSGNANITFNDDGEIVIQDKSHQLIAGKNTTVTIEYTVSDGFETDTGLVTIKVKGTTDEGDQVRGTAKADHYRGFDFDDFYFGVGGNDVIGGGNGYDFLVGGSGRDKINGGDGRDTIVGGTGDDKLNGGSGKDIFIYSPGDGRDVILLQEGGTAGSRDIIDLSDFGFRNFNQVRRMTEATVFDLIIDLPGADKIKIVNGNYLGIDVAI
jgi:Ca2+-binding RTX toxin-like protein